MGTSLSGLTPATTFDGLLKVGDNDPLTADLKAISTGDGTDTMLELSTTALQIGGATGMYWDNTNKRLGIGTDAPSVPFEVYGSVRFRDGLNLNGTLTNSSTGEVNINNLGFFDTVSSKVGIGENTPTARLQVKGSGATDATNSLIIQNSVGTERFRVRDDGLIFFGRQDSYMIGGNAFSGNWYFAGDNIFRGVLRNDTGSVKVNDDLYVGGNTDNDTGVRLQVKGSGTTSATTSLLVQNSAGTDILSIKDDLSVVFNSTITSASSTLRFDVGGVGTIRMNSDQVAIGGNTTPTARLHVKGSGNDATTTALLVQNSDGADAFKITDNKIGKFFSHLNINGHNYVSGNLSSGSATIPSGTRAYIKGLEATSATTALLVQNSAGTDMFKVEDDGNVSLGSLSIKGSIITGNAYFSNIVYGPNYYRKADGSIKIGGGNAADAGVRLQVKGSGNDATTTALLVQNSDGDDMLKVTDDGNIETYDATGNVISKNNAGNRRFEINPDNTTLVDFQVNGGGFSNLIRTDSGINSVGIGTTGLANTMAYIKGTGATSATTALLVQNSAGTDMLKVRDDGAITMANNAFQILSSRLVSYRPAVFGGALVDNSAVLQATSTTKGFLPPRMTEGERNAIATPAVGLIVYQTDGAEGVYVNTSTGWKQMQLIG